MRHHPTKSLLFVALVAALAVPQPLRACCMAGGEDTTCCRHAKQVAKADAPDCCRKSTTDDNCGDGKSCLCCRSADPRIASADRLADNFQPDVGAAYLALATLTPNAGFSADNLPAPPGGQTAIPHRILHCSWLI